MFSFYLTGLKKMFSVGKKVFLVIAVFVAVITIFSRFIAKDKASLNTQVSQISPIEKNRAQIYKVINDKKLNSTKQGKLTIALYRGSMCLMIGEACTNNPKDGGQNFNKSVFGFISKLIIIPYANPPASGIAWVSDGLQQAGFIPKTMASEGIGFAAIQPFSSLWKIFRDLSYMLLVIVLIAIGFMIMFRAKINPQTVISVENALPKIVIALILITFSFAIAGFMIDIMYILIGLIVSILSNNPNGGTYYDATQFKNEYMMSSGTMMLWRDIRVRFGFRSVGGLLGSAFTQILPAEINLFINAIGGVVTVALFNWVINLWTPLGEFFGLEDIQAGTFGIGKALSAFTKFGGYTIMILVLLLLGFIYFIPTVVMLVIGFSILFLFFRLFFILFTSYLKLIIIIVFAPFLLLFEAVPGKSAFKYWLMNIIGNLMVFPITIVIFVISYLIVSGTQSSDMTARLPYLYGIDSDSFRVLIGMGLIFLIPDLIKTTKELLGIKDLPFTIGIGTFTGGIAAGVGGGVGLLGQFGSLALATQYIPGGRKIMEKLGMVKPEPGGGTGGPPPTPLTPPANS